MIGIMIVGRLHFIAFMVILYLKHFSLKCNIYLYLCGKRQNLIFGVGETASRDRLSRCDVEPDATPVFFLEVLSNFSSSGVDRLE